MIKIVSIIFLIDILYFVKLKYVIEYILIALLI